MKKLFLLGLIAAFLFSISLAAAQLTAPSSISLAVEQGSANSTSFVLNNTNNTLNAIDIVITAVGFSSSLAVSFNGSNNASILVLQNNSNATIIINVSASATADSDDGSIIISGNNGTNTVSIAVPLYITVSSQAAVMEDYCEEGSQGDITLSIDDPDSNESFDIGESIKLKLKVKNLDDDDQDIIIETDFYDLTTGEYLDEGEETDITISDDTSKTVYLNTTIPADLDDEDSFAIVVKAYFDGDEEDSCAQDSILIKVERAAHDVKINEFTLNPAFIGCGTPTEAIFTLENLGSEDEEKVSLRVYNTLLGVNTTPVVFEDFSSEDIIDQTPLSVIVPLNKTQGNYTLTAEVSFDYRSSTGTYRKTSTKTAVLEVKGTGCANLAALANATNATKNASSENASTSNQKTSVSSWFNNLISDLKGNTLWMTIDIALIAAIIIILVWLIVKR